ncbi:MAG TPA: FKBP-type peptidyl-prolyl cis-trans isomerase [Steroidobacteraceae bacterium]|jgi:FKBP-type peptidyl-prolyl cis-trans isomerase|nr:FKBP-type peptidyl-prolyl cis-trans isomerase [Steroidobacteraceae bacterium]
MTLPARRGKRALILLGPAAALTSALCVHAQQPPASAPAAAPASAPSQKAAAPRSGQPSGTEAAAADMNAVSYSLGVSMGDQLRSSGISPDSVNSQRLAQGVRDALSGKVKLGEADQKNISQLLRTSYQGAADANHRAAAKFLAENGKKPGVISTASGLQYLVLAAGSGESPKATDEATVNYRGTLLDGTEFDSSYRRGQPATFPVSRVIPGWTEALQLMKPGAKYRLFVPPQLAYDMRPKSGLPPGSLLIFEVELLSVKPGQAAATPPAQPPAPSPPK